MALKATIHKAQLQIADMDRGVYAEHALTIARHPSENDERMVLRVLAFALHVPANDDRGMLELAKSLWDADEPDLWQRDLTGQIVHWMELGQPDDRRLHKASSRAERVTVLSHTASTPIWWAGIANKLGRANKVAVWQIAPAPIQELAALVARTWQWQITVQDGTVWVNQGEHTVELTPTLLKAAGPG
ncbi:MAG: YaeQ family protein [Burkholderiales bacterium]